VVPGATAPGSGRALGWAIIAGMAVSAALLVGLVAVANQLDTPRGQLVRDWLALGVGPLLVALGLAAMWSAGESAPALAGVAGGVGTVGAWALSTADGRATASERDRGPADPSLGAGPPTLQAVVRHRAVEGTALAGAYVAGSAVGILGAVVLASHVTAKAAAVGGLYGTSRVRTTSRALLLQGVFLAGAVGGLALVGGPPPVAQRVALALAGGVLVAIGAVETAAHVPAPRPPNARVRASDRGEAD
jgi:hypothetical protein